MASQSKNTYKRGIERFSQQLGQLPPDYTTWNKTQLRDHYLFLMDEYYKEETVLNRRRA